MDPHRVFLTFSKRIHPRKLTFGYGKPTIRRCISYWTWGFSIVMSVFGDVHLQFDTKSSSTSTPCVPRLSPKGPMFFFLFPRHPGSPHCCSSAKIPRANNKRCPICSTPSASDRRMSKASPRHTPRKINMEHHGTQTWRFGRWCFLSFNGWFVGSSR